MKRILFIVGTHGNELAPLQLYYRHPYGRIKNVEWDVIVANPDACFLNTRYIDHDLNRIFGNLPKTGIESSRARMLKSRIINGKYDAVYDVHTSTEYKPESWQHCAFINSYNSLTRRALEPLNTKHVIWDKDPTYNTQYTTSCHPVGITLEYQKYRDIRKTIRDIMNDFNKIIHEINGTVKRTLYTADRPISHDDRERYKLILKDFYPLTLAEKKYLRLSTDNVYVPVFTDREYHQEYYCFLNKKAELI